MGLPIQSLTKKEWALWIISLILVAGSNILSPDFDLLTLIAALIGVTSLIFAAKGSGWGQVMMVIFSILYGIISYRFHYWGEMVTYLGMTLPMSVWSAVIWFKNPSKEDADIVEISSMTKKKWGWLAVITLIVTVIFFYILMYLKTPNLIFSTLSITTSFIAASLTLLRSSYYALFYAMNDVVLIVLWVLASIKNPVYIPVVVNFLIFLINDTYGFVSWKKREIQ